MQTLLINYLQSFRTANLKTCHGWGIAKHSWVSTSLMTADHRWTPPDPSSPFPCNMHDRNTQLKYVATPLPNILPQCTCMFSLHYSHKHDIKNKDETLLLCCQAIREYIQSHHWEGHTHTHTHKESTVFIWVNRTVLPAFLRIHNILQQMQCEKWVLLSIWKSSLTRSVSVVYDWYETSASVVLYKMCAMFSLNCMIPEWPILLISGAILRFQSMNVML